MMASGGHHAARSALVALGLLLVFTPAGLTDEADARQMALSWVDDHQEEIRSLADQIWDLAEPAFQEFQSAALLRKELERHGFRVSEGEGSLATDFVAEYGSGRPVLGILAEYDALPGLSQERSAEHRPRQEGGTGHGCGHNLLGAGAVGGVLALKAVMREQKLPGTIRLYGTPAEEGGNGKVYMVRAGLFDDVDVVLQWHPSDKNDVDYGSNLAVRSYRFRFRGLSAHAALNPDRGRSALDAVELMNAGVNALREHVPEDTRIHYIISEGGSRPNIVPDFAEAWYYVRSPRIHDLKSVAARIEDISRGATLMTGTDVKIRIAGGSWNMLPNRTLSEVIQENLDRVGAPEFTEKDRAFARELRHSLEADGMSFETEELLDTSVRPLASGQDIRRSSSDVGDVSWVVPMGGFHFAARIKGAPSHSWPFVATAGTDIGHKAAVQAARLFAATGVVLLTNPEIIARAHEEFLERQEGTRYQSLIPATQPPPKAID